MPTKTLYSQSDKQIFPFQRGEFSASDPTLIPRNSLAQLTNCVLTDKGYPTQCLGQQRFNPTSMGTGPTVGGIGFLGEDEQSYIVVASNGFLWWSNGNGTFAKVTYQGDGTIPAINTAEFFYKFQQFYINSSGTQQTVVFVITNNYPIVSNSNGTHAQQCTTSRALMLYVSSGTVYAKNIFYDTSPVLDTMWGASYSTWTTGTQSPTLASDTTVGHGVSLSGGVELSVAPATAAGFNDMYKAESFNGTDKTVNLSVFCDVVNNVDYIYLTLSDVSGNWSRFEYASSLLAAGALTNMTFNLTSTPSATSGTLNLAAVTKVTIGVHTTALQALNYTFSQLIVSASGSDDQAVGHQSNNPPDQAWPEEGTNIIRIFDKILITVGNSYYVSQAKNGLNWTNPTGAIDVGGGTINEPYTGAIAYGTSALLFTRNTLTNVNATPGDLTTWREVPISTTLGNIGNQIGLGDDGFVYYYSPRGIARTNGQIAELCDYDIQDQTTNLAQLNQGYFQSFLNQATDWKAGALAQGEPSTGEPSGYIWNANVSGSELKQTCFNTQVLWQSCPSQNINTIDIPNAVQIGPTQTGGAGTNLIIGHEIPTSFSFIAEMSNPLLITGPGAQFEIGALLYPSYFIMDLGNIYYLNRIGFGILYANFGITIHVLISADGISWTEVINHTNNITNTWSFTPTQARYVQFYWNSAADGVGNRFINFTIGSLGVFACFFPNASIETPAIDYGAAPTTYGDLVSQVTVPLGCTLEFWGMLSSDGNTWGPSFFIGSPGNNIVNQNYTTPINPGGLTYLRYLRIQAVLTTDTTQTLTPILYFLAAGSEWISAVRNLGSAPTAWGPFSCIQDNNTVTYAIQSSANGSTGWSAWQTVTNGAIPTIPLYQYIRYRIDLTSINYLLMPDVQSVGITYYIGASENTLPSVFCFNWKVYVSYMQNNSLTQTNDSMFVGELKLQSQLDWQTSPVSGSVYPMWSDRDFIHANSFWVYNEQLMCGDSELGFANYLEVSRLNCAFIFDDFLRPASNTTLGNATTGQTWTYGDIGGGGDTDVFGILPNQTAFCANANVAAHARYALLSSGLADCNVICTFPVLNPNQGLILRYVDDNNYLALFVSSAQSAGVYEYIFQKVVSGVSTLTPSIPSAASVGQANEGDTVRVNLNGTTVTVFINDVQVYQATVTNTAGTYHGLYLYSTGYISSEWENFAINYVNVPNINYTSTIITPALIFEDVDVLIDFLYLYYASNSGFYIAWRFRILENDWSLWSDDPSINNILNCLPSPNICRSRKLSNSQIPNSLTVQFKITQPEGDNLFGVSRLNVYLSQKPIGR